MSNSLYDQRNAIIKEAEASSWKPEHEFSVFHQMDHSFYDKQKSAFTYKYNIFRAIAKTLNPSTITELGTCAGSAIDAYNAGADALSFYQGYDIFPVLIHEDTGRDWDTYKRAKALLKARGLKHDLVKDNLRNLSSVKGADLVCVDAGHVYRDSYRDLKLAFTSSPTPKHIFLDDYVYDVALAFEDIERDFLHMISSIASLEYTCGGGLLIELKS